MNTIPNNPHYGCIMLDMLQAMNYLNESFPEWPQHEKGDTWTWTNMECECLHCTVRNWHLQRIPSVDTSRDIGVWKIMGGKDMWYADRKALLEEDPDANPIPDWHLPQKISGIVDFQETANRYRISVNGDLEAFLLVSPDNLFNNFHDAYMYLLGENPRRKGYWRPCDINWAVSMASHEFGKPHHYPHCTWYGSNHEGDLSWRSPFTKMPLLFQQPENRVGTSLKPRHRV